MPDAPIPDFVDRQLWIRRTTCSGRDFLIKENPHTFPGRMECFCPHRPEGLFLTISLDEILDSSIEARYFAQGFVAGSEPNPPVADDGYVSVESAEYDEWNSARSDYLTTGYWPVDVPRGP